MSILQKSITRLQNELKLIHKNPMDNIKVKPNVDDIYTWYFLFDGPTDTPYEGGLYAGKILFPKEYPSKPPDFVMLTPNGRFKVNEKICLSYSSYHPETWSPIWTVPSMLQGLLSFMIEKEITAGSILTTDEEKQKIAKNSIAYTFSHPEILPLFCQMVENL
jgi:ubiquitin-conjugating enzyme E2 J2